MLQVSPACCGLRVIDNDVLPLSTAKTSVSSVRKGMVCAMRLHQPQTQVIRVCRNYQLQPFVASWTMMHSKGLLCCAAELLAHWACCTPLSLSRLLLPFQDSLTVGAACCKPAATVCSSRHNNTQSVHSVQSAVHCKRLHLNIACFGMACELKHTL